MSLRPLLLSSALLSSVAFPSTAASQRVAVVPPGTSASATLSPAVRIGDVLFVSGQLPDRGDTTIQGQTRSALEAVKKVVDGAGSSMANVAKCTVFLVNVDDFAGMNSVYTTFFPKEPPARSTVVVKALVRADAKLEVECIAALPGK